MSLALSVVEAELFEARDKLEKLSKILKKQKEIAAEFEKKYQNNQAAVMSLAKYTKLGNDLFQKLIDDNVMLLDDDELMSIVNHLEKSPL